MWNLWDQTALGLTTYCVPSAEESFTGRISLSYSVPIYATQGCLRRPDQKKGAIWTRRGALLATVWQPFTGTADAS